MNTSIRFGGWWRSSHKPVHGNRKVWAADRRSVYVHSHAQHLAQPAVRGCRAHSLVGAAAAAAAAAAVAGAGTKSWTGAVSSLLHTHTPPTHRHERVSVSSEEGSRASPPHRPRANELAHPADTSRSNLAEALGLLSSGFPNLKTPSTLIRECALPAAHPAHMDTTLPPTEAEGSLPMRRVKAHTPGRRHRLRLGRREQRAHEALRAAQTRSIAGWRKHKVVGESRQFTQCCCQPLPGEKPSPASYPSLTLTPTPTHLLGRRSSGGGGGGGVMLGLCRGRAGGGASLLRPIRPRA